MKRNKIRKDKKIDEENKDIQMRKNIRGDYYRLLQK
tara:strand:- start:502 stop:609 length:108 start_codon:yes stop_codon:yes gene_type:complete